MKAGLARRWLLPGAALAAIAGLALGLAVSRLKTLAAISSALGRLQPGPFRLTAVAAGVALFSICLCILGVTLYNLAQLRRLAKRNLAVMSGPTPWAVAPDGEAAGRRTEERAAELTRSSEPPRSAGAGMRAAPLKVGPSGDIGGSEPLGSWAGDATTPSRPEERGSPLAERSRSAGPTAVAPSRTPSPSYLTLEPDPRELPVVSSPASERLVAVWERYLEEGDGRFEPGGLGRQLEAAGINGKVVVDPGYAEGGLGVDLGEGQIYLLPHFDKTPPALAEWFDANASAGSRLARIRRVLRAAVLRRGRDGRLELGVKGLIE